MKRICVYCGSSTGNDPSYVSAARALAGAMVDRGLSLVYGGGHVGLMGSIADAILEVGGEVIGVIPEALVAKELAHHQLSDLRIVSSMHERKALMAELSDAFIAAPGGFGTLEEFFETLTWAQLGLHPKPCSLLNVGGFYDPLLAMIDHTIQSGFVPPDHRRLILVESDPVILLDKLGSFVPPNLAKWIGSSDEA